MTIKIAHLYYDVMNLYGENGNCRALKKFFEYQGVNTEIHFLTINDKINFNEYDCFYIGCGTENSQIIVLNDMLKRKNDIESAINSNKFFLLTGNSYELFGDYIIGSNKLKYQYYYKKINQD